MSLPVLKAFVAQVQDTLVDFPNKFEQLLPSHCEFLHVGRRSKTLSLISTVHHVLSLETSKRTIQQVSTEATCTHVTCTFTKP